MGREFDSGSTQGPGENKQLRDLFHTHGQNLHESPPELKKRLAEEHGIYTTTEPRKPESFGESHEKQNTARELGQLRENTRTALSKVPGYTDEEKLGKKLSDAFGATTHLRLDGIYYEAGPKGKDGTTVADSVTYTVPNKEQQDLLSGALQGVLRTAQVENIYPVYTDTRDDGTYTVRVHNYDEYVNRVVGNAIDQLVAKEDLEETGTVLPPGKHTHKHWKDEENETFHPIVDARMEKINTAYHTLEVEATYRDHPDMQPMKGREDALGTDSAAVFPAARDGFRPLIHYHRGGTHTNLEQNPDKEKRLLIENGVNLTRGKVEDPEDTKDGPLPPRALYLREQTQAKGTEKIEDIKNHPIKGGLSVAGKLLGAGVESAVDLAVTGLPAITEQGKKLRDDRNEWKTQQRNFEESQEKITKKLTE